MKTATRCVTLLATLLIAPAALAAEDSMTRKSNRAEWMAKGSYGIMVHYLISPRGDPAEARTAAFDQIVAGFKKAVFLEQFASSGADWLIFTIGQDGVIPEESIEQMRRLGQALGGAKR